MRQTYLASLLLAVLGLFSVPVTAAPAAPGPASAVMEQMQAPVIDLNKADAATLQAQLSGIGKTKADAIVAFREEHGDFASVDELLEIKGIGKALLERNRDKLTVN